MQALGCDMKGDGEYNRKHREEFKSEPRTL